MRQWLGALFHFSALQASKVPTHRRTHGILTSKTKKLAASSGYLDLPPWSLPTHPAKIATRIETNLPQLMKSQANNLTYAPRNWKEGNLT
jgi:hypothetical protein